MKTYARYLHPERTVKHNILMDVPPLYSFVSPLHFSPLPSSLYSPLPSFLPSSFKSLLSQVFINVLFHISSRYMECLFLSTSLFISFVSSLQRLLSSLLFHPPTFSVLYQSRYKGSTPGTLVSGSRFKFLGVLLRKILYSWNQNSCYSIMVEFAYYLCCAVTTEHRNTY